MDCSRRLLWIGLAALALAGAGCARKLPGESLGHYSVTGTLEENSCGMNAVPTKSGVKFKVEMRSEDGVGYWKRPESPIIQGIETEDMHFMFEHEQVFPVFGGGRMLQRAALYGIDELGVETVVNVPGCAFRQVEQLDIELRPESNPDPADIRQNEDGEDVYPYELDGLTQIRFYPSAGSDCSPVAAANGGPFLEFPCVLTYSFEGNELVESDEE